jgi:photosystem II stability/assembly factor-like uncharacterized protein
MIKIKSLQGYVFMILFLLFAQGLRAQSDKKVKVNKNTFGAIEARHIGPAVMSGRIAALDAVQNDPRIIYVGSASGGLWKSTNGGVQFKPIFDKYCQSIGSVTIDQQRPDTVWVGTGESWTRNSTSVGDGIYRTFDGGENWKKMGLDNTERIARIIIHPNDPDIIYVAALGHLWNANEERGVFKSKDGGENWERILFIDENTGCSDLAIDPLNPEILYAGMWDFRRSPDFFRSGGPGSGLHITKDGGENWNRVEENLPSGTLGRIAVSVSPVDPNIVYALIESEKSALYRSDDKGLNWQLVNDTPDMGKRPFYFSNIMADPVDTNFVYKPGFIISVSENKGKTFRSTYASGGNVHVDMHALWISKNDNNLLYLGTDGGFYISNDKGGSWRFCRNLPVSQFYHVSVDDQKPYNVYGGLQDNGSWKAPSKSSGGILNKHWDKVGGGDGFYVFPDQTDKDILYWQYQGGNIFRRYLSTGESKEIKPFTDEKLDKLRFNWNTPIAFDESGKSMYVGSQYLFKTIDKGDSWKRISPDLTTNDPQKQRQAETGGVTIDNSTAENHCTIITINASPLDENIIYVGTDDGNLQLTKDGGQNWMKRNANIPGLPNSTWVSYVCPSRYDTATAYVTFDGHRNGDMSAYVYKTADFGITWTLLSGNQINTYCYKIIEDTQNPDLLFLGTEKGLYVSIDGGEIWSQFKGNLPDVSIRDMVIQERENDLILGTHGRGVMIIDDISPLRELSEEMLQSDLAFLPSRPYELTVNSSGGGFLGDDDFIGDNPPQSVAINYYLKKRHIFGDMQIQIFNESGEMIKEIPAGKRKGINRVFWQMRMKAPKAPSSPQLSFGTFYGPNYPPGKYTIKILKGDKTYDGKVEVIYDPAIPHSIADRDARQETIMKAYALLEDLAFLDEQLTSMRNQVETKLDSINNKSLHKKLAEFVILMDDLHDKLVATKEGIAITGEEKLRERIAGVYSSVMGYQGRPTQSQLTRLTSTSAEFDSIRNKADQYFTSDITNFNKQLEKENLSLLKLLTEEEFMKEDK